MRTDSRGWLMIEAEAEASPHRRNVPKAGVQIRDPFVLE
jgi:hypothetical protein